MNKLFLPALLILLVSFIANAQNEANKIVKDIRGIHG